MSFKLKQGKRLFHTMGVILLCIMFYEIVIGLFLKYPAIMLPSLNMRWLLQDIYAYQYRNLIQFDADCAQYDPELTYVLRQGKHLFANTEFKTIYNNNSAGLRDDEESLREPDIIVVGDSYAMGWGVQQNETYASILEAKSGYRVLNAAIASYATAREIILLNRLDTSHMKYLVIHFSDNDFNENKTFYDNKNVLPISSEEAYQRIQKDLLKVRKYYFGKYSIATLKYIWNPYIDVVRMGAAKVRDEFELHKGIMRDETKQHLSDAYYFINVLMCASHMDLSNVVIIVTSNEDDAFLRELHTAIKNNVYPAYIRDIRIVHVVELLKTRDYFILDDHLRASGHAIIANELLKIIRRS